MNYPYDNDAKPFTVTIPEKKLWIHHNPKNSHNDVNVCCLQCDGEITYLIMINYDWEV